MINGPKELPERSEPFIASASVPTVQDGAVVADTVQGQTNGVVPDFVALARRRAALGETDFLAEESNILRSHLGMPIYRIMLEDFRSVFVNFL